MAACIVCRTPNATTEPGAARGGPSFFRYDCPRCGSFVLSENAGFDLEGQLEQVPLRRSLMSHTLRRMQRPDNSHLHIITKDELPTFWREERLPTPLQQVDNLIVWVGDNQAAPSIWAETTVPAIAATIGIAISLEQNDSGALGWVHSQILKQGLYREQPKQGVKLSLMLEMAGWERYEALRKQRVDSRFAFMALKFGQPKVDRMVAECVRPAVARTGVNAGEKLHRRAGAKLHHDGIGASLIGLCGTEGGCARSRERSSPATA